MTLSEEEQKDHIEGLSKASRETVDLREEVIFIRSSVRVWGRRLAVGVLEVPWRGRAQPADERGESWKRVEIRDEARNEATSRRLLGI